MVERPIKKSERQTIEPKSDIGEEVKGKGHPIEDRRDSPPKRSFQKKDRSKARGKGNQEEPRNSNTNPALVRGPKPQKPKPPVIEETPEPMIEDSVTETSQETTTEE